MTKKLLLFDIDYTLINTLKLKTLIDQAFIKELGITEKEFKKIKNGYLSSLKSSTDFNPNSFIGCIAKNLPVKKNVLKKIYYQPNFYQESLFPETISSLNKLKRNYRLGIYSEGLTCYQLAKLILTKVTFIFSGEKPPQKLFQASPVRLLLMTD